MSTGKIVLLVVLAIIVLLILFIWKTYNSLVGLKIRVDEAFATMDVYLKKRFDLIPNIVATVKGYAKHESETLENVIKMRGESYQQKTNAEKIEINKEISAAVNKILVVAENYPELKADKGFLDLSKSLKEVEEDIANSRKYYNAVVKEYNIFRSLFPKNIVANMFNFEVKPLFEIEGSERENVKVEF